MSKIYRYGHRSGKRHYIFVLVVLACFAAAGGAGFLVVRDVQRNGMTAVEGAAQTVGQSLGAESSKKLTIEEPFFTMQLPGDWKETGRQNVAAEHSITWQATKKGQDNRWLTLYVDTIPRTKAVNRLLPLSVQGSAINAGDLSDNCATFTGGGSLDTSKAVHLKDTQAKWAGVDFLCNLPNVVDNQVGTGSPEGINQVTVTGKQGTHTYFFLYVDRNIQPNYSILTDTVQSFRAK